MLEQPSIEYYAKYAIQTCAVGGLSDLSSPPDGDIRTVRVMVNSGTVGLADVQQRYDPALKALDGG